VIPDFRLKGISLPTVDSFLYLGLPVSKTTKFDFFDEKFRKVEKAFYSLNGLGCKPQNLSPFSIGFIYKQYCQSIFSYGLECMYLPAYKQNEYNIRQNILIKQSIGLSEVQPVYSSLERSQDRED